MNKDSFQDKYQEIFQEMKEEKMNWNFDDFLAKTEEKPQDAKIVPLHKKSSKQWMYIAASIVLIAGFGVILKNNSSENTTIKPTEIAKTNTSKTTENQNIANDLSIASNSDNSIQITRNVNTEPIKRKKSKYKNTAQYLAQNSTKNHHNSAKNDDKNIEYNPNFVIINGKPVATEDEAIKYTKNAIDMLGGNINTALEKAEPVKLLTVNF